MSNKKKERKKKDRTNERGKRKNYKCAKYVTHSNGRISK